MIRKLLCWIGIHRWDVKHDYSPLGYRNPMRFICTRCGKLNPSDEEIERLR